MCGLFELMKNEDEDIWNNVSEIIVSIIKKNKISKENNKIRNLIWLNSKK